MNAPGPAEPQAPAEQQADRPSDRPLDGPAQESARLRALGRLELLDTSPDPELDRLTAVAARSLGSPICLVSLVDRDRLWFENCQAFL